MVETVQTVGRLFWLVMPAPVEGKEGEDKGKENYSGSTLRGRCKRGCSNIPPKSRSRIVGARCIAWDLGRDLALLKITHAQALDAGCRLSAGGKTTSGKMTNSSSCKRIEMGAGNFSCVKLPPPSLSRGCGSSRPHKEPLLHTPLVAIGHPADEHPDDPPGVKAYGSEHRRVLQLSSGRYLGIAPDKVDNPQDNSDTGAMQHDCWTYWGHSGGPIFEQNTGVLVGVHVDWNPEEPLVKRAVPWVAVEAFLEENGFWS